MYIQPRTISFEHDGVGVSKFNMYYKVSDGVPFAYEDLHVEIPFVEGKFYYEVIAPTELPLSEGTYQIGLSASDESGNISDIVEIESFFDFTAPSAPFNVLVS